MVGDSILTNSIIKQLGNNKAKFSTKRVARMVIREGTEKVSGDIINSKITATHEKLSALNTFYYMRMDNGFFAPVLAFISYLLVIASINDDLPIFTVVTITILILITAILRLAGLATRSVLPNRNNNKQVNMPIFNKRILVLAAIIILSVVVLDIFSWFLYNNIMFIIPICLATILLILAVILPRFEKKQPKLALVLLILALMMLAAIPPISEGIILIPTSIIIFAITFAVIFITPLYDKLKGFISFINEYKMAIFYFLSILLSALSLLFIHSLVTDKYEWNYEKYISPTHKVQIVQTNERTTYDSLPNLSAKYIVTDIDKLTDTKSKIVYSYETDKPINEFTKDEEVIISSKHSNSSQDITSITEVRGNKTYEITRINGHLLPCVIAFCLVYMLALLSYIPIIYFERRDTWNHYVN